MDSVDLTAAGILGMAAFFVIAFFWQASAGAARSDRSLRQEIEAQSRRRVEEERAQISLLLSLVEEGDTGGALKMAGEASERFNGNSQLHLLLARLRRRGGELEQALAAYRRALESNRDYSDRRSGFYLGEELRPFLHQCRSAFLGEGAGAAGEPVRDLFFIERSLAGGCH